MRRKPPPRVCSLLLMVQAKNAEKPNEDKLIEHAREELVCPPSLFPSLLRRAVPLLQHAYQLCLKHKRGGFLCFMAVRRGVGRYGGRLANRQILMNKHNTFMHDEYLFTVGSNLQSHNELNKISFFSEKTCASSSSSRSHSRLQPALSIGTALTTALEVVI